MKTPGTRRDHWGLHEAPYHFAPVVPDAALMEKPTYHDGVVDRKDPRHSGELRITLRALTPLLVANEQVLLGDSDLAERLALLFGVERFADQKKILEPLAVPGPETDPWEAVPERVLLAGSSLKGMARQAVQSLLSAPMERVWERSYSYRPLAQLATGREVGKAFYAGQVLPHAGPGLRVRLLRTIDVDYLKEAQITPDTKDLLERHARSGAPLEADRLPGMKVECRGKLALRCGQGIDGQGTLGRPGEEDLKKREEEHPAPGIPYVLVPVPGSIRESGDLPIRPEIVEQYQATVRHLADVRHGHLADHPRAKKNPPGRGRPGTVDVVDREEIRENIRRQAEDLPRPGEVLFLEVEETYQRGGSPARKVLSFGRHFRYRWCYTDSTTRHGGSLREVVIPTAKERKKDERGGPEVLTGGRLFFGYVGPRDGRPSDGDQPFTSGIGEGDFTTLAGRVAIDFGVEQLGGREPAERFLRMDRGGFVPLRVLSRPRASAIEFYLDQDPARIGQRKDRGLLLTYGEFEKDEATGELRGRKHYLHQPAAASEPGLYEFTPQGEDERALFASEQCSLARFVSTPDTTFRCTLRFRDLRSWELGALIVALFPSLEHLQVVKAQLKAGFALKVQEWIGRWGSTSAAPLFAHKLGHGRPLGLGSVAAVLDALVTLRRDRDGRCALEAEDADAARAHVEAFARKIGELRPEAQSAWVYRVLLPWLELHRFAGRGAYGYPLVQGGKTYDYHTKLRAEHLKGRRYQRGSGGLGADGDHDPRRVTWGLKPLDRYDEGESR